MGHRSLFPRVGVLLLVIMFCGALPLWASVGGGSRLTPYEGTQGDVQLRIALDSTVVRLESATNTFLVIPVTIVNKGKDPVRLGLHDTLVLKQNDDGPDCIGRFGLKGIDAETALKIKQAGLEAEFTYPAEIDAARPDDEEGRHRPATMTVYALFKLERPLKSSPHHFTYTLDTKAIMLPNATRAD